MKILLCFPPSIRSDYQIPDIGLGYLASSMRKNNHCVDIYQPRGETTLDKLRYKIREFQPDVLGIKVYSLALPEVKSAIAIFREERPSGIIILGGPHVSVAEPNELFDTFPDVDFILRGEGEISLPMLIRSIELKCVNPSDIPGMVYKLDGVPVANPPLLHRRLDDFDDPAWDLIDPRTYTERWFFWTPEFPAAPILTSRGCPHRCAFCAQNVINGKIVRWRSLDRVLSEMDYLMKQYGVRDFDFIDDNFLMNPEYVRRFCSGILERGWKIRFNCCGARLDNLDKDLVIQMERAGCNVISVGLESGSKRLLDYMRKGIDLEMVRIKTKLIADNTRIKIMGMFILGYPTSTREENWQTIRYSMSLPLFAVTYFTYVLLPGCEEFRRLRESGEIQEIPWEKLSLDDHVYSPRGMTLRELKHLFWKAHLLFFLRPRIIFRILKYSWRRLPQFIEKSIRLILWRNY